jgi:queuine tRNA-ribosyltransferase
MHAALPACAELLPANKPRYLMGVGRPIDLLIAVAAGIDIFDCVLPTRNGRNATAFTSSGIVKLRNARHRDDPAPLEEGCDCYTCLHASRAYLHHLFAAAEMLGPTLVSLHNIRHYLRLMAGARDAIREGRYGAYVAACQAGWGRPSEDAVST